MDSNLGKNEGFYKKIERGFCGLHGFTRIKKPIQKPKKVNVSNFAKLQEIPHRVRYDVIFLSF